MVTCQSSENALIEAEEACLRKICEILNFRAGVNAFICVQPGLTDCCVFDIGNVQTGDQTSYPAGMFHFRGNLTFYAVNRKSIQRSIMRLLLALPNAPQQSRQNSMIEDSNVIVFRIAPETNAIGAISTVAVQAANNKPEIEVFTAVVSFDIVFSAVEAEERK